MNQEQNPCIRTFDLGSETIEVAVNVIFKTQSGTASSPAPCKIDQRTGALDIPQDLLWGNVENKDQARSRILVRGFELVVAHLADAPIVVLQRQGKTNRFHAPHSAFDHTVADESVHYASVNCNVSFDARKPHEKRPGRGDITVWTSPMNSQTPNRLDVIRVTEDGELELFVVYLTTLDDGKSFQVVGQQRWIGQVYRRKPGTKYSLRNEDERVQKLWKLNENVRDVMNRYVFVPGEHAEDVSGRMQMFQNIDVVALLDELVVPTWNGEEDFWITRDPPHPLNKGQGIVRFHTYGVGRSSFGIVELTSPVRIDGIEHSSIQFDFRSISDPQGEFRDGQGIYFLPPGMVVHVGDIISMGKGYPPLARLVVPQMIPVGIEQKVR